jgi:hypothetical protein
MPGALEPDVVVVGVVVVVVVAVGVVVVVCTGTAKAILADDIANKLEIDNIIRAILINAPIFILSLIINL